MPCARNRESSTLTRNVLPPPERALTSSVPLSCAGSNGLINATSRPGSVNANGIPVGEPQPVPTSGTVSPTWRGMYPRVRRGGDLPRGLLDRLGQLHRVGDGAALADRLVDRDLKRRRALMAGELL